MPDAEAPVPTLIDALTEELLAAEHWRRVVTVAFARHGFANQSGWLLPRGAGWPGRAGGTRAELDEILRETVDPVGYVVEWMYAMQHREIEPADLGDALRRIAPAGVEVVVSNGPCTVALTSDEVADVVDDMTRLLPADRDGIVARLVLTRFPGGTSDRRQWAWLRLEFASEHPSERTRVLAPPSVREAHGLLIISREGPYPVECWLPIAPGASLLHVYGD